MLTFTFNADGIILTRWLHGKESFYAARPETKLAKAEWLCEAIGTVRRMSKLGGIACASELGGTF